MNPNTCDDIEDAGDESPADWLPFKPGRPYGVYPTPPGLVHVPAPAAPDGAENWK